MVAGGWPRLDWWRLLVASYVAPLALGQAALWLASRAWRRLPIQQPSDPALLLSLVLLVHLLTSVSQQAFPYVPWSHPPKLAAALYAVAAACGVSVFLSRTPRSGFNPGELLIPFAIFTFAAEARVHESSDRWAFAAVALTPLFVVAIARGGRGRVTHSVASVLAVALVVGVPVALHVRRAPLRHSTHFVSFSEKPRAGSSRGSPNILMIVLDTVRASSMSAYAYARETTPRLEALARRGRLYSRFSIVGLASQASHASLFTGLYPSRHGAGTEKLAPRHNVSYPLVPHFRTLAEALAERGYATAAVSANSGRVGRRAGLDQGFSHFDARPSSEAVHAPLRERVNVRLKRLGWTGETTRRLSLPFREANEIVDAALDWHDTTPTGEPYFLFLNFMDAHQPYLPPPPFQSLWQPEPRHADGVDAPNPEVLGQSMVAYDGSLRFLDREIGRLLDRLSKRSGFENTWIFVLADHGEAFGEHGTFGHYATAYEEVVRVPLIVVPPANDAAPAGGIDDRLTQIVDIAPTILARLGEPIDSMDGIPFAAQRPASYIEIERATPVEDSDWISTRVWIRGPYKLIVSRDRPPELYRLDVDPTERRNLAKLNSELLRSLQAELESFVEGLSDRGLASRHPEPIQRDQWRTLRALGYIE